MRLLMGISCCWSILRISSLLLLIGFQQARAQEWQEVNRVTFDAEIVAVSTDFQNNIYVALADDQLLKLNESGAVLTNFSQPNLAPYTLLEAQVSLNPFFFVRDNQQVVFLDRFLANPVVYDLNQWSSGFVWLATPSLDRQLWLLENDPFRIIKVDRFTGNILHEVYLQIGLEVEDLVYFRAQQQSLVLVDRLKGIYLFDLFGNLIKYIEEEGVTSVQMFEDQLIYYAETAMIQLDLNTGEKTRISVPDLCWNVLKTSNSFLCIGSDQLVWWRPPEE